MNRLHVVTVLDFPVLALTRNKKNRKQEILNKLSADVLLFLNPSLKRFISVTAKLRLLVSQRSCVQQRKLRTKCKTQEGTNCSVLILGRAKRLKRNLTINILLLLSRPALYFFEGGRTWQTRHKSTSSHYDKVFGLTQFPQVVMNIDYTLKPIADKNIAAYFTTCILLLMQNYCVTSKTSISLKIFACLGFFKTVIHQIISISKD